MKVQIADSEDGMSEFLTKTLESKEIEKTEMENPKDNDNKSTKENAIDVFKIRQLEQKQELLVGLTNLLFKKFEEMHPTKKFSKFEFTDISWYKKLGTTP